MRKRILSILPLVLLLAAMLCTPAFALTKSEVEAQVAASSKEAVTGNVLIWFLCAVAFLKVSQKIDSFMASLGVSVGRTGGSLMAETMIAARGVSMLIKAGGSAIGGLGRAAAGSSGGASTGSPGTTGGFFKGGLIGMAGRHITNSAVKTTTSQTAAVHTVQNQSAATASYTASSIHSGGKTDSATHTASSVHSSGNTNSVIPTVSPAHSGGNVDSSTPTVSPVHSGGNADSTTPTVNPIHSGGSIDSAIPTASTVNLGGSDTTIHSVEHTGSEVQSDTAVFSDTMAQQEGIITGHESQSAVRSENNSQISQTGSSTQAMPTSSPGEHVHTKGSRTGTIPNQGKAARPSYSSTHTVHQTSIGGAVFARSLASGGKFANDVIGTVARGDIRSTGSITGDLAAQSLSSYMGYTALGAEAQNIPRYSDVEIGGGRITGTETPAGSKEGLAFGMYHAAQYTAPEGPHEKVYSADGTLWYKQYAQDSVERKPYKAPDGTVAYEERIIKKLPSPPKRKDRI